jgi:hypothetical protein
MAGFSGGGSGSSGGGGAAAALSMFQARMQRDSATQISLQRYIGVNVEINGETLVLGAGGLACLNTDNLITAAGADSGGAPAVTTLYYAYVSNLLATYAPGTLRLSATAPSLLNGIKVLATSGNGADWRFVGWVRTISNGGTANFADSLTQRLVVNYYNRLRKDFFICPAYADDNANTTYQIVSATYVDVHSGNIVGFISNGEDAVEASFIANIDLAAGNSGGIGIGIDSSTNPDTASLLVDAQAALMIDVVTVTLHKLPAEGYHTLAMLGTSLSAITSCTFFADFARNGATVDPPATYLSGTVKV